MNRSKIITIVVSLAMVLTMMPMTAFGETSDVLPELSGSEGTAKLSESTVATIDTQEYTSLEDAVNAVGTGGVPTEIVLQETVTGTKTISVNNGKNITLNLNGNDIGFAEDSRFFVTGATLNLTGAGRVYEGVRYYAPVMICGQQQGGAKTNVTVGSNVTLAGWSALFVTINKNKDNNYGINITVNGTLESYRDTGNDPGAAIYVNGQITNSNGSVNMELDGAKLSGKESGCSGMYLAGYTESTIRNSTIIGNKSGGVGIEARAGKITVYNSSITGGSGEYTGGPNGNGSTSSNVAVAVVQHTTKLPLELTVSGDSTLTGTMSLVQADEQKNGTDALELVKLSVEDGVFNGDVDSENKTGFVSGGIFTNIVDTAAINTDSSHIKYDGKSVVGNNEKVKSALDELGVSSGDAVEVIQTGTDGLNLDLPSGVTVNNKSGQSITVNNTTVADNDSTVSYVPPATPSEVTDAMTEAATLPDASDIGFTAEDKQAIDDARAAYEAAIAANPAYESVLAGTLEKIEAAEAAYVAAKQTAFKATEPEIELSKEVFTYNKKDKTPDVIKGLEAFTEGVDYDVTYENNTKAGIGQVIIEGKGDLAGFSVSKDILIKPYRGIIKKVTSTKNSITITSRNQKAAGITGYQFAYRITNSGDKWKTKMVKASNTNKRTFKGLKSNTRYTVKVRGIVNIDGTRYFGKWSELKKIRTK